MGVALAVLLVSGVGATYATDQSNFAVVDEPNGVANRVRMLNTGAEYRMFVTRPFSCQEGGTPAVVFFNPMDAPPRQSSPFAKLTTPLNETPCPVELYLEVSPGLGGFPKDWVYVTWGHTILKIPPEGCPDGFCVQTFAAIRACGSSHTGITFDPWGAFGFKMIVTCTNGKVFAIGPGGGTITTDPLHHLHTFIENPGVAHPNFGPCGGCVFVAAEDPGSVYAIRPDGSLFGNAPVASWLKAEAIHPVPPNVCNFGTSGGAFFTALFATELEPGPGIYQFPKASLAGLNGAILVTSEPGPIGKLLPNASNTGYVISQWHEDIGHHEGGDFCPRIILPSAQVQLKPNPPFDPRRHKVFTLTFLSSPGFRPLDIDTDTIRAGRVGNEDSRIICFPWPVNRDRILDLVCLFESEDAFGLDDHDHWKPKPPVPPVTRVFWSAFTLGSSPLEDPPLEGFAD